MSKNNQKTKLKVCTLFCTYTRITQTKRKQIYSVISVQCITTIYV